MDSQIEVGAQQESVATESDTGQDGDQQKAKRQKSTIAFPYGDLEDAVAVVQAVWRFGSQCDMNNLAAALKHETPASGAFRIKVATAKTFGLIDGSGQTVELTPLGRQLIDERTAEAARAEAFLRVPLYQAIFDEVSTTGGLLPQDAGLEDMLRRMGVVATQVDRARQAFQRSARQAGYNQQGARRLLRPAVATIDVRHDESAAERDKRPESGTGDEGIGMNKPAIITELFRRLPDEGESFPAEDRKRWKAVFEASLDLIYGPSAAPQKAAENGAESASHSSSREA